MLLDAPYLIANRKENDANIFDILLLNSVSLDSESVRLCAAGAVEVRKEGLEAQINRLAELIGRLENKVRNTDTPTLICFNN